MVLYDVRISCLVHSTVIYQMTSDLMLVQYQTLPSQGAISVAHATPQGTTMLVLGNNQQDQVATPQDSAVYRSVT